MLSASTEPKQTVKSPEPADRDLKTRPPVIAAVLGGALAEEPCKEWEAWLEAESPHSGFRSLVELESRGCDRRYLVRLLMFLQQSNAKGLLTPREAKKALGMVRKAHTAIRRLQPSALGVAVGLASLTPDPSPLGHLCTDLGKLTSELERTLSNSTKRENLLSNRIMGTLVRYVRWATKSFNDELMQELLAAVLQQPSFGFTQWRKRHRSLWQHSRTHCERWDLAVKDGKLRSPVTQKRRYSIRGG
jgi:hypothetical protein